MQLKATNICKAFDATIALDNVDIEFNSGEVRAVVGENGAGKSTLLKVICGVHRRDSGQVSVEGELFETDDHIEAAHKGIAYVFQETMVNPYISIAENIFIDRLKQFRNAYGLINYKKLDMAAQTLLDDMGANINVHLPMDELDLGQWKIIEIARALSFNPKVIFFDESTAFLNNKEIHSFLDVVRKLKSKGFAIGFVSHHMNEIFEIADVATIMKDGKVVANRVVKEVTVEDLQLLMVGRTIGNIYPPKKSWDKPEPYLEVKNLSIKSRIDQVSFTLNKGEICCIGGLKGSGGEDIFSALIGDVQPDDGAFTIDGKRYVPQNPNDARSNGIALLPGERTLEGLISDFSIRENINMGAIPRKGFFIDEAKEHSVCDEMIKRINIKTKTGEAPCRSLSGGNMQKVVIGKCLATHPDILLLNNPTRGIDVGARFEIYNIISNLSKAGMSVLLLSEDLLEIIGLCDRAIVMRKGQISKIYSFNESPSEEDIIKHMI